MLIVCRMYVSHVSPVCAWMAENSLLVCDSCDCVLFVRCHVSPRMHVCSRVTSYACLCHVSPRMHVLCHVSPCMHGLCHVSPPSYVCFSCHVSPCMHVLCHMSPRTHVLCCFTMLRMSHAYWTVSYTGSS